MTQKKIAELFGVKRPAITKHLKNIFETGELEESSVSSILEHTAEKDWINFLHQFLELSSFPILKDKGKISVLEAKLKAEQ